MVRTEKAKRRILLVEDDLNLGYVLMDFLEMEGFDVKLTRDGETGWNAFQTGQFDLCLLDCMLPVKDGFSLAKQIRAENVHIPIIFLTAKSLKEDKLRGFDLGGDDYITKPFDEDELVRRINAVLKRSVSSAPEGKSYCYTIGRFVFDYPNLALNLDGQVFRMTQKEGEVLRFLCENKNQVMRREEILVSLWGENDYFNGRSLDVFITKLRKYLKMDESVKIQNVHGVGFVLVVEETVCN